MEKRPFVALQALDELWFQVGGTLCNLSCTHCFVSCNPSNDSFKFLGLERVKRFLRESVDLGVKEYYFTGGEPFLNRELLPILEETLCYGPASVLTNGTVFQEKNVRELRRIADGSRYTLELRVSIDGPTAEINDPLRGAGAFDAALHGVDLLVQEGFLPIITVVQTWPEEQSLVLLAQFADVLRRRGYTRPRLKLLPTLRIGMEAMRTRGYTPEERVHAEMLEGYDVQRLICSHSRIVTDRGVAVCPILIEEPGAHLGETLADALTPFAVSHAACYTCYLYGSICVNASTASPGRDR
ncbi:MAG TPA: radical SAM protein [Planctomycetota bacterium]|nr:radical SAM protein [Planctomycetota bacterium]